MRGVLRKHRRTENKIGLTDKLDPHSGSSSLLCSTKANIPASWTRRDNSQWDGTSRLKKTAKHLPLSSCFHTLLILHRHYLCRSHSPLSPSLSRTWWGRHAARLRRFLSSPDPGDAFTSIENRKML